MNNNFFAQNTIKKIYQRRSYIIKIFKDLFLTPKQKKFYDLVELPNHWEYETIFQCIMESWLINKNKKIQYENLLKKQSNEDLSFELYKIKPLQNLNILEIGGYFVLNLEKLGAKTTKKDSAIDEKEYITLENYRTQLKNNFFDITFSKELFDLSDDINNKKYYEECKKLLTVFSNVTKQGGISIHEGSMPEIIKNKNFLNNIDFKLICTLEGKRIGPIYDIYIFKKNN